MDRSDILYGRHAQDKWDAARAMRRAMTPAESALWQRLRASRLGGLHFRRQQVIDGYIADFYCHSVGIVVEVDGEVHRQQADEDAQRDAVLSARGLLVLRFPNDRVLLDTEAVLTVILDAAQGRTAPTP